MFSTNKIVILLFVGLILSPSYALTAFAVDPKILIKDVVINQATNPFEIKLTNGTFVFKIDSNGKIQTGRINSFNQLPSTTSSSVLVTDSSGYITASSISTTILNFLSTLSSDVQTQLNGKQTTTLTDGNILVGSSGNVATSVNPSGDVDVSNIGAFSINSLVIVDGDISGSAGIDATKIGAGGVTSTEFGYIGTLSSDAQTQINGKQATLGYTAGTLDDVLLENVEISNSRANINYNDTSTINFSINDDSSRSQSNVTAGIVANSIGDTQLGSSIDTTQLGGGGVTSSEFDFLADVTSLIQAQINGKQTTTLTDGNILVGSSGNVATSVNPTGDVDISNTGVFSIANIHSIGNVTSVGCATGEILKVSGTTWGCATDSTGTGGALDDVLLENIEVSNSRANLNYNDTSTINFSINDDPTKGQANVTASVVANSIDDAELGTSIDTTQLAGGGVTSSEFDFLADVTSLIQAQINGKQATLGYTAENTANKNANFGYPVLGSTGQLQKAQQNATTVYTNQANTYSGAGTQDFVGSILDNVASINDNSGAESTSGFIDLGNAVLVCWEQAPAGADICISVDANEDYLLDTDARNFNFNSNPITNAVLGGQIDFAGNTILNTGTLTLPTSTDTLMGKATTDVMTGKTLKGNSTGNSVIADPSIAVLTAGGATLQATNSPPKTTIDGTNMDYITLDFDTTTDETVIWNFEIPNDADTSANISAEIRYLKSSAGTGDGVCWSGAFLGRIAGETVDNSFGTAVLTCDTTINTAGQLDSHKLSFTTSQHGLSAGDVVFFKLFRDADNGSDGLTIDIRLVDVKISWT